MLRIFLIALVALVAVGTQSAAEATKPTVAVLYFDNNSGDKELDVLSKGFADMLITDISSTGSVTVVEREKLQTLLDESKLQRSKFFDRKAAVKIGKGLGARYVLSGSFIQVKPQLRIDVRMIDVSTSEVVLSTTVKGSTNDVFQLEQRLVRDFLNKLNQKFFATSLPPTKVPDLEALLAYSQGLAFIDKGEDAKAAALMKSLIKKAPAFGLARTKHADLVRELAQSSARRDVELHNDSKTLYAEAKAYIGSHRVEALSKDEAAHYLAYRTVMGHEIISALHAVLKGRKQRRRVVPRKGAKPALGLMRAYYNNQRLLVEETDMLTSRHGRTLVQLPDRAEKLASALKMSVRDGEPSETLLNFLLHGRAPSAGALEQYDIAPAFADIDPKMKKAALALAKARLALVNVPGQLAYDDHQVRVLTSMADWHINRGRIEKGIGELQKILDRFPKSHRWPYIEKRIQEQLGLKSSHQVRQRNSFEKGLAACDDWPYHVGKHTVIAERVLSMGLQALPYTEKELKQQCSGTPKYAKMQKTLYQTALTTAGSFDDCEWFNLYMKKWLSVGGTFYEGTAYRKNYSDCL